MAKEKQQWTPIEFADLIGMSTNTVNPGSRLARRILNLHPHEKKGALKLRPGYNLKYEKPSDTTITGSEYPDFDFFFDRQADINGKEVTVEIQKGVLNALSGSNVADTLSGFFFWCRPYWDGSKWTDEWQWINKTIITKIVTGPDSTYKSMIKIYGNSAHGLGDDSLIRYVIYNKTKEEFAKIITCKAEGDNLRLNISLFDNSWEADDIVIISKYWIDTEVHAELYNNCEREDIVFHNVLNDIRIGFGGYENRPGIAIGYRKNSYQISEIDFPDLHTDLEEADVLEKFSEIDEIVLDTHILNRDSYGIELEQGTGGSLPEDTYHIRLTGRADGYTEQLLAEEGITVSESGKITMNPFIILGKENPRLTDFKIYYSSDRDTYFKIKEIEIKSETYSSSYWTLNRFGRLILGDSEELHTESNAASISNESNSEGSWTEYIEGTLSVSDEGAGDSDYSLKFENYTPGEYQSSDRQGIMFPITGIKKSRYYEVELSLKAKIPNKKLYMFFIGASLSTIGRTETEIEISTEYDSYSAEIFSDDVIEDPTHIVIAVSPKEGNDLFITSVNGTYRSQDDGDTWESMNNIELGLPIMLGDRILAVSNLTSATDPGVIYASFNNGESFSPYGTGITGSVFILRAIDNDIYAGTEEGSIYKSEDKGQSWTLLNADISGGSKYSISDIAKNSSYLFASTINGGVYRSDDDGETWTQVNNGIDAGDLWIDYLLATDSYLFASAFDSGGSTNKIRFYRTDDNGDNWTEKTTGLTGDNGFGLIEHGGYIFLATTAGDTQGIYRSNDNGDNWSDVASALADDGYGFLFSRNDILYTGTFSGKVYQSEDDGANWDEIHDLGSSLKGAYAYFTGNDNTFNADLISIKEKNDKIFSSLSEASSEMNDELRYTATYDLVKGWDQVLELRGRKYYLNPYINRRHENFLLVSIIHSDGSFMWDISSFSNYRELERFDSNRAVGMILLANNEIMILKDKSLEILRDDGTAGIPREPVFGVSCISRDTIRDLSGKIIWGGLEDIYTFSLSSGIKPILEDTIRDLYLKISEKDKLFAIRDRYNTYRLRVYDALNTEYLFIKDLPVEEQKELFAEVYREDKNQNLNFLNEGNIYEIERDSSDGSS